MIKIVRVNPGKIQEEYISPNIIRRCWSETITDKEKDFRVEKMPFDVFRPNLELVADMLYYQTYKDKDGNEYAYTSEMEYLNDLQKNKTSHTLYPGWNKIVETPEETHAAYFIETDEETIEITEETFENILKTI